MDFNKLTEYVDSILTKIPLQEKVNLFKTLFNYPVDYKDGKYYYGNNEWDEFRMSDFLTINQHWLSVPEYDKIHKHLTNNEKTS
jgi:hypothetical protein